jgi:predicted DCC family thiol-disulfide oxidoreductase YuxK
MRFAPLQGPTATAVFNRHPELEDVDSLVLVEGTGGDETTSTHSDAVLRIGGYLGGIWASSTLLRFVPKPLRDGFYRLIARHRYRVFGRHDVCPTPPPEVRARFLP